MATDWAKGMKARELKALLLVKQVPVPPPPLEKRDLVNLVVENVGDEAEARALLAKYEKEKEEREKRKSPGAEASSTSAGTTATAGATAAGASTGTSSGGSQSMSAQEMGQQADALRRMTPDQMRYQAQCMRRDPGMVRSQNALYASMSDADIRALADNLEKMANNPQMKEQYLNAMTNMKPGQMQEMQQLMSKLTPEQRRILQQLSQGEIDATEENLSKVLPVLRENRDLFKAILMQAAPGAMGSGSMETMVDQLINSDAKTMATTINSVRKMAKVAQPAMKAFQKFDSTLGGYGRHICICILAILAYFLLSWTWALVSSIFGWVFGSGGAAPASAPAASGVQAPAGAATGLADEDEFVFADAGDDFDDEFF